MTLAEKTIELEDAVFCDCMTNKTKIGGDEIDNTCLNVLSYDTTISLQQDYEDMTDMPPDNSTFIDTLLSGLFQQTCEDKYETLLSSKNVDSCKDYKINPKWNKDWDTKFECRISFQEDPAECKSINKYGCCYAFLHETFRSYNESETSMPTMHDYSDSCTSSSSDYEQAIINSLVGSILAIILLFPLISMILKRDSTKKNWIAYVIIGIQTMTAVGCYLLYEESVDDVGQYQPSRFLFKSFVSIAISIFVWDPIFSLLQLQLFGRCTQKNNGVNRAADEEC